jgi:hypothetical protein
MKMSGEENEAGQSHQCILQIISLDPATLNSSRLFQIHRTAARRFGQRAPLIRPIVPRDLGAPSVLSS